MRRLVTVGAAALACVVGFALASDTGERFELNPLSNFYVGWTPLNTSSAIHFTVRLYGKQAWIAAGVSPTTGVGANLMEGAGVVIGQATSFSVSVNTQEYVLQGSTPVVWEQTGPSPLAVTQCVQGACPDAAGQCTALTSCEDAISCTVSSLTDGNSSAAAVSACTGPIANNSAALGAYMQVAGCYFSSCADSAALKTNEANIVSTTYTRDTNTPSSTMTFTALGAIASQTLPVGVVTLIFAFGESDALTGHGASRGAVIVDLSTGEPVSVATPQWVVTHAALLVVGLGVCMPLAGILRAWHKPGAGVCMAFGVVLALAGLLVATPYVSDFGEKPHTVVGAVALAQVAVHCLIAAMQPARVAADDERGWAGVMSFLSYVTFGLVLAAAATGYQAASAGIVQPPAGAVAGVIVIAAGWAVALGALTFNHLRGWFPVCSGGGSTYTVRAS